MFSFDVYTLCPLYIHVVAVACIYCRCVYISSSINGLLPVIVSQCHYIINVLLCSFMSCCVPSHAMLRQGGSSLFIPSISSFSMPECNRLFLLCRCCSSLRSLRSRVPADRHHHCRGKARSPPFCISPQLPLPCPG